MSTAVTRGVDEVKLSLRRAIRRAVLAAIAVVLLLGGCGFLLAAGFIALADRVGALDASLIVGGALLLAGVIAFLLARQRVFAERKIRTSSNRSPMASSLLDVGREMGAAASRNPGSFVLGAFVLGLLLGRRGPRR